VYAYFAKRIGRQRVVALALAYALAASSLVAGFAAGRAAVAASGAGIGVICHTEAEAPLPTDPADNKACVDSCCTGCLTATAALPPVRVMALARTASHRLEPPTVAGLPGTTKPRSHRSRAPPQNA
jgi:hypothetical protein